MIEEPFQRLTEPKSPVNGFILWRYKGQGECYGLRAKMPVGGQRYTLRGFSDELDWRCLHFVDRLPPSRICSVCGIVVRRTCSLPCRHTLCGACYQQQRELGGAPCCPFDGEACPEESVRWREFPAESLLEKRVKCWNEINGCTAIVAASDLPRHLNRECKHHIIFCPKCSAKILWSSVCSHLRSCPGRQGPSRRTESAQTVAGGTRQAAELAALAATLSSTTSEMKQQVADLSRWLERMLSENSLQTDQMSALSHTVNNLKEAQADQMNELARKVNSLEETQAGRINDLSRTLSDVTETQTNRTNALSLKVNSLKTTLTQDLATVVRQVHGDIDAVKDELVGAGRETLKNINSVLRHTLRTQSTHLWVLTGYSSLKARVMAGRGSVEHYSHPVYLCHYLILPGARLRKTNWSLSLHLQFCLQKGELDEYLQWPFQKRMVFSVLHPETRTTQEIVCCPEAQVGFSSRPTTSCNKPFYSFSYFCLRDLERDGYVKGDQLVLSLTLIT